MNGWNLTLRFVLPHERLLVGWQYLQPDENDNYYSIYLYLSIISVEFNWGD